MLKPFNCVFTVLIATVHEHKANAETAKMF